jgi:hypothetical protein
MAKLGGHSSKLRERGREREREREREKGPWVGGKIHMGMDLLLAFEN